MNFIKTLSTILIALTIGACAHVTPQYAASATNVEKLREFAASTNQKLSLTPFNTYNTGQASIGCAEGSVETPNGKPFEKYIEEAFASEVKLSGLYNIEASNKIGGRLDNIDFNLFSNLSSSGFGKWIINMTISGTHIESFKVETVYPFSAKNVLASASCKQAAEAFPLAVQDLVSKIISHPSFKALVSTQTP